MRSEASYTIGSSPALQEPVRAGQAGQPGADDDHARGCGPASRADERAERGEARCSAGRGACFAEERASRRAALVDDLLDRQVPTAGLRDRIDDVGKPFCKRRTSHDSSSVERGIVSRSHSDRQPCLQSALPPWPLPMSRPRRSACSPSATGTSRAGSPRRRSSSIARKARGCGTSTAAATSTSRAGSPVRTRATASSPWSPLSTSRRTATSTSASWSARTSRTSRCASGSPSSRRAARASSARSSSTPARRGSRTP